DSLHFHPPESIRRQNDVRGLYSLCRQSPPLMLASRHRSWLEATNFCSQEQVDRGLADKQCQKPQRKLSSARDSAHAMSAYRTRVGGWPLRFGAQSSQAPPEGT